MRASVPYSSDSSAPRRGGGRLRRPAPGQRRICLGICLLLALGLTQGCGWLKARGVDVHGYKPAERTIPPPKIVAAPTPTPTPTTEKPATGQEARPGNPAAWGEAAQIAIGRDFEPVYFSEESAELDFAARRRLANYVQWLHEHPKVWVSLAGHCGSRSSIGMAYNVGMARALAVQDFLISQGLDLRRFFPISFGQDRPAAEGESPEAQSLNNRVELLAFNAPIGQAAPEPVAAEAGSPPAAEPQPEEPAHEEIP